ncbi:hypothetical protein GCM10027563_07430 [Parasphingorhabdus pacifica]
MIGGRGIESAQTVEEGLVLAPEVGKELLAALDRQIETVAECSRRSHDMAREAPLGNNAVGLAMAAKFRDRAGGEQRSLDASLERYREALEAARDGVRQAMDGYAEQERERASEFERIEV